MHSFLLDDFFTLKKENMMLQEIQIYSNTSDCSKNSESVSCSHTKLPQVIALWGIVTLYEDQNQS